MFNVGSVAILHMDQSWWDEVLQASDQQPATTYFVRRPRIRGPRAPEKPS